MTFKCETIETADGIVCRHCRLWPDLCTCDPEHPIHEILGTKPAPQAYEWSQSDEDSFVMAQFDLSDEEWDALTEKVKNILRNVAADR